MEGLGEDLLEEYKKSGDSGDAKQNVGVNVETITIHFIYFLTKYCMHFIINQ